jgi:hypothetical protein
VLDAPVEEWIGGCNVGKKRYTEIEYVAIKSKYFIIGTILDSVWSMFKRQRYILPTLPLSFSEKENRASPRKKSEPKWT